MTISLHIEADDMEEMASKLRGMTALFNPGRIEQAPLRAVEGGAQAFTAGTPVDTRNAVPASDVNPKPALGPDELAAGMTLKETQSTTLGDDSRVAPGGYVTFRGETWHVYKTYRGKIIAGTEDNRFDVLDTKDCTSSAESLDPAGTTAADGAVAEPEPARAGTAAALIAPDGGNKIEPKRADELRSKATNHVQNSRIPAQAVFDKLKALSGGTSINDLSLAAADAFDSWLDNPTETTQPTAQFGF